MMLSFYKENARWLLGGFLLATFSGFGQTFFISIWSSEIRSTFSLSHGDFGLLYMGATLASAIVLPVAGRLVDVVSIAVSALIVIVLLAVASLSMAMVNSIAMLFVTIFLLRLFGQGMMTHTAITAMGRWYSANRGKAVSSATIGHQCSEALFPTLFVAFAISYGWRNSWLLAVGCLLLFALPMIFALMRVERIPRSQAIADASQTEQGKQWTRSEMLRDPLFWLMAVGVFSPAFIGTSIFFHQDYLSEINNWPESLYANSFALMALMTVIVALVTGYAVDRWSAQHILPAFMAPLSIGCFILGSFTGEFTVVAFMMFLGISYGISSTLFGAIWPEVYGTRHLGSLRAVTVSFMVFMSAAGPGLTGVLIDWGIPFSTQLLYLSAFCAVCVVLMKIASSKLLARQKQLSR